MTFQLADERTSRELKSQELDAALKQLESLRHETDSVRDTEHRNLHNLQVRNGALMRSLAIVTHLNLRFSMFSL